MNVKCDITGDVVHKPRRGSFSEEISVVQRMLTWPSCESASFPLREGWTTRDLETCLICISGVVDD